ncbi:MAG: NADH-quinone oxidoreductase subunit NuoH [SAR324 cluster bacterium]|nr:NADH-quinone oxidoreductase subunit NuoH [SAR324 cluster bacterium]
MESLFISLGLSEDLAIFITAIIVGTILIHFLAIFAGFMTWIERRLAARFQFRCGPNRVGPQGLLQWLADAVKLIIKEEIIPQGADQTMFRLAPFMTVVGVFATFVVLPWGPNWIPADLDVGLLYLISITALVVIGILMAGWASNSKWALLGGMRAAAQIVSYEIPVAMGLLPAILIAGSLSMGGLMRAQGWLPWDWIAFQNPFSMLAFLIFFVGSIAESNRVPFDLPEAESELVAGFFTEYTGFRFAAFGLAEFGNCWVVGATATAVFLGGGNLPGFLGENALISLLVFSAKTLFMIFVLVWLRWTLPRFRIDQLMEFSWKYLLPMSFVAFFGQAVFMLISWDSPMIQQVVSHAMFLGFLGLLFKFSTRVVANYKEHATPVNSRATDYVAPPVTEVEAEAAVAE